MKKNILKLIILLLFAVNIMEGFAQKKSQLRVLYVGGSANWEDGAFQTPEERQTDVLRRTASFEDMLENYFEQVTVIDARSYTQATSDTYDVTIIDGTPKAITERKNILDDTGRLAKVIPATYFTESFSKPVIFIGETGEKLGRSIGVKMDWYCLCLDADAHNFRKEHAIFKGPFPVKMTIEEKPTPESAFHYEYFSDKTYPKTLPMWKVQTKGYISDKNFRIGMVARPWGFEDSPEAEYISSGVCAKTLDAVALGRHGNFFHWGFAASPEYMTDEAQTVLANAVVYISKFKDKGVISRKYNDRRATRDYLREKKYLASKESYEESVKMNKAFETQTLDTKKIAEEKKAKNEKLTPYEQMSLSYQPQPESSFEDYMKRHQKELFSKFGTNTAAYIKYYDENKDYFYGEDGLYVISIDEDAKSLGIPNNDKRLLDKAISMLEKGQDVEKAKRLLKRYTLVNFETPDEWRKWYEQYKNKLFFTETGGFYFMVNSYDQDVQGNNYERQPAEVTSNKITPSGTDDKNPVSIASGIVDKGANKEVVVKVRIHPGYHIYAFVSDKDPFITTDLKVDLPVGYTKVGELKKPSFKYFSNSGTTIYEDEILFTQEISGSGNGEVVINISYQCCDDHICFPPVDKSYTLNLRSI